MLRTAIAVDVIRDELILDSGPVTERDYVLERVAVCWRYERCTQTLWILNASQVLSIDLNRLLSFNATSGVMVPDVLGDVKPHDCSPC